MRLILMLLLLTRAATAQSLYSQCFEHSPACNYSAHALTGFGASAIAIRLGVKPQLAMATVSFAFVAKEVRDHLKWGNQHDMKDAALDIASGIVGAFIASRLFRRAK